ALDYQNSHFRVVQTTERPLCQCNKEKSESELSSAEGIARDSDNSAEIDGTWYGLCAKDLEKWVNEMYKEVRSWKQKNLFDLPKCNESKEILQLMSDLLTAYTNDSKNASFSLMFYMILPTIMLQKINKKAALKQNINSLKRRLNLLKSGMLVALRDEMRIIRADLGKRKRGKRKENDIAREFSKTMMKGRINPSLRMINNSEGGGPLEVTNKIKKMLEDKHPKAQTADNEAKVVHQDGVAAPYLFEGITENMVWMKALKTQGGAGPSGINADMMRDFLSTKKFGEQATNLRTAIAGLARKLATQNCRNTEAYTARRLLALEKLPEGIRPIGIGEVLNRIIGKCVMHILKTTVRKAAGNLQVCAGHLAGGEAAIHAMREIYEDENIDAVLLVDAKNAFNTINREAMLHNIKMKCPSFSQYVENTYGSPSELFIEGDENSEVIMSEEGTTQGDPIAMAMYALGLSVLQDTISVEETNVKSVSYADDLIGAGNISDLYQWWRNLEKTGKKFGYFVHEQKSCLVVKPEKEREAREVFSETNLMITTNGQTFFLFSLDFSTIDTNH
ncbi:MAG: reverse transcriptase domain-containing protein, partial [Cyanobacteria bacterium J06614_10]